MRPSFGVGRVVALAAALAALGACKPELPGRGCATDDDCFREERCVERSCVPRPDAQVRPESDADVSPTSGPDSGGQGA
ncbi:MAG: hypothetical protein ACOYM9_15085 [Bradymonadia bacterium]